MKRTILWLLACLCGLPAIASAQNPAPVITVDHKPNTAAQQAKPYVVLVSLDGFRYDYARKYSAKHLLALGADGAMAPEGMIPAYPSLTFPNHYTLVTGLYPEHHGILGNEVYNPKTKQLFTLFRPDLFENGGNHALAIFNERQQQVDGLHLGVAELGCTRLRLLHCLLRLYGEFIPTDSHVAPVNRS